jgi:hypothetical protein
LPAKACTLRVRRRLPVRRQAGQFFHAMTSHIVCWSPIPRGLTYPALRVERLSHMPDFKVQAGFAAVQCASVAKCFASLDRTAYALADGRGRCTPSGNCHHDPQSRRYRIRVAHQHTLRCHRRLHEPPGPEQS